MQRFKPMREPDPPVGAPCVRAIPWCGLEVPSPKGPRFQIGTAPCPRARPRAETVRRKIYWTNRNPHRWAELFRFCQIERVPISHGYLSYCLIWHFYEASMPNVAAQIQIGDAFCGGNVMSDLDPGATAPPARPIPMRKPNGDAAPDSRQDLLHALEAMRSGDFSVRMSANPLGLDGKIAAA